MSHYELNNHKRSDTIKWVIAFSLIAVLLLGMVAAIFLNRDNTPEPEETVPTTEAASQFMASPTAGNGIQLMAARTAASTSAVTTAAATDSVTINATLTAATTGYDDTIQWAIAFKNPSSVWASGKNAADYVTMAVASDTHSVTVTCNTAFGEPIIITATSVDNTDCTATCQLDYVKRVTSVTAFKVNSDTYENYARIGMNNTVSMQVGYGVGTLTPTVELKSVTLTFSSGLSSKISSALSSGMTARSNANCTVTGSQLSGNTLSGTFALALSNFYNGGGDYTQLNNTMYLSAFDAPTGTGYTECKATASVQLNVSYGGVVYQNMDYPVTNPVLFERGALRMITSVETVSLDKENIVF